MAEQLNSKGFKDKVGTLLFLTISLRRSSWSCVSNKRSSTRFFYPFLSVNSSSSSSSFTVRGSNVRSLNSWTSLLLLVFLFFPSLFLHHRLVFPLFSPGRFHSASFRVESAPSIAFQASSLRNEERRRKTPPGRLVFHVVFIQPISTITFSKAGWKISVNKIVIFVIFSRGG